MESDGERKKATRSRRVDGVSKGVVSKTGLTISEGYCRMCMKTLPIVKFYQATDTFLDKSGFMSICKEHCSQIYTDFYKTEKSMEKVLLRMCRMLNIRFGEDAVSATRLQLQTQGKQEDDGTIFGIYKSKVVSTMKENVNATSNGLDMTFHEIINSNAFVPTPEDILFKESDDGVDLKQVWGEFSIEDYEFLEKEFAKWSASYSCSNEAEEYYIREICIKKLELRKARLQTNMSTDVILKAMDILLKNSGLTPAQSTASSNSKSADAFGVWIKDLEDFGPAERFADHKMFYDVDNADEYIEKFFVRSQGKFILSSPDFQNEKIAEMDDGNFDSSDELA